MDDYMMSGDKKQRYRRDGHMMGEEDKDMMPEGEKDMMSYDDDKKMSKDGKNKEAKKSHWDDTGKWNFGECIVTCNAAHIPELFAQSMCEEMVMKMNDQGKGMYGKPEGEKGMNGKPEGEKDGYGKSEGEDGY